jgi:DNA-binding response OmpR family regulator
MKLLVVDDDAAVLEVLLDVLRDAGFTVTLATSAEDAIAMASGAAPDVLVTDLDLGTGMNGIELAAEARRRWPNLPVVYISGRGWLMHGHQLDDREVYLPKPFHQNELLGGVQAVANVDRPAPAARAPAGSRSKK